MATSTKSSSSAPASSAASRWSFRALLLAGFIGLCSYLNSINVSVLGIALGCTRTRLSACDTSISTSFLLRLLLHLSPVVCCLTAYSYSTSCARPPPPLPSLIQPLSGNAHSLPRPFPSSYSPVSSTSSPPSPQLTPQSLFYLLTPSSLHASVLTSLSAASAAGASGNASVIIDTLITQLVADHPQMSFATDYKNKREWVFNNAGGAMGSMFILHASITE
jgi:hypothetical protein